MPLLNLFDSALLGRADALALECESTDGPRLVCTFGEIEVRSNRLAHSLRKRGLVRGDRIAFFLINRIEIIDLWIAAVKLGLIVVPINVLYRERELRHILGDAEPKAVVTSRDLASFIPSGVTIWDIDELSAEAVTLFPKGFRTVKPYLRFTPQPNK